MPEARVRAVSFRSELMSSTQDLADDCGFGASAGTAIAEVVQEILNYTEEGERLFPQVFITEDMDSLMGVLDVRYVMKLGEGPSVASAASAAIKYGAPIRAAGWHIWMNPSNLHYGTLLVNSAPMTLSQEGAIRELPDDAPPTAFIAQVASECVHVSAIGDRVLQVFFSATRTDDVAEVATHRDLTATATESIADAEIRSACESALDSTLDTYFREGHGTLIAVLDADEYDLSVFDDCLLLPEPLDLAEAVAEFLAEQSLPTHELAVALFGALGGMLGCDGIVLLSSDCKVLGFNAFAPLPPDARDIQGGARRRAFEALKALVDDEELGHVFMRSSDGSSSSYGRTQ